MNVAILARMEAKKDYFFAKYRSQLTEQKKNGCMAYPMFRGKHKVIVFDFSPFHMNNTYDGQLEKLGSVPLDSAVGHGQDEPEIPENVAVKPE